MEFIIELIIGIVSISLSIWFFWLAKKSEKKSHETLDRINQQVEVIKQYNERWLDKSIAYLTDQKSDNLFTLITKLPDIKKILSELEKPLQSLQKTQVNAQNKNDVIAPILGFYVYSAKTNILSQFFLSIFKSSGSDYDNKVINFVKTSLKDSYETYSEFNTALDKLFTVKPFNQFYSTFLEINNAFSTLVRNYEQFIKRDGKTDFVPTDI